MIVIIKPRAASPTHALCKPMNYTYGDQTNIKITTAEDNDMFEGYILMR